MTDELPNPIRILNGLIDFATSESGPAVQNRYRTARAALWLHYDRARAQTEFAAIAADVLGRYEVLVPDHAAELAALLLGAGPTERATALARVEVMPASRPADGQAFGELLDLARLSLGQPIGAGRYATALANGDIDELRQLAAAEVALIRVDRSPDYSDAFAWWPLLAEVAAHLGGGSGFAAPDPYGPEPGQV